MQLIKQSESTAARKKIAFTTVSSTNLQTRLDPDTLTFTVRIIKSDGTSVAGGGSITHPDDTNALGVCYYAPSTGDIDTLGQGVLRVSASGMETREVPFVVVPWDPYDSALGILDIALRSGRTIRGHLRRMDALFFGKATGLLGSLVTLFQPDGSTTEFTAAQNTTAGTRETATVTNSEVP